jgi:ureidoacrylate peracid hydrolase
MQDSTLPESAKTRVKHRLGREHAVEEIDPRKSAFVVVDMQNYFMEPGMPACCDSARDIVGNVNRLAERVREAGGQVVWIVTEALPEDAGDWLSLYETYSPDAAAKRRDLLSKEGAGFPLWPEMDRRDGDLTVIKTRYSAFIQGASELERELREKGIDTVLVGGVSTNVCCESTARDAMMLGFRTLMVGDANAAFTEEEHRAALTSFYLYFGDVRSTADVIGLIDGAPHPLAE